MANSSHNNNGITNNIKNMVNGRNYLFHGRQIKQSMFNR